MKKLNKYLMLFVAAFALVSCVDDVVDTPTAESKAGEDVQFGLSLPSSRTVYGAEVNSALPIYWSDNDKVQIYSPECAAGHNDAEYNVTPVASQSYAEKLTKTGAYGVQWGDDETANFYSVYPSLNADFEGEGSNVTATLHILNEQKSNATLKGTMFTDMDNVVMYAQTNGVTAGDKVNLTYTPYSTVLSFTLNLGMVNGQYGSAEVNSLTLTAPEGTAIAGDFTLKFNGTSAPTIAPAGNNTNSINVTFISAPTLNANNKTLTINVPVIPLSNVNIDGWTAEVKVQEGNSLEFKTYTKTLGNGALKAGKIHKITLPAIAPATAWTYNLANWITSLDDKEVGDYKNIYLTELSIPGAWYSLGKDDNSYQAQDHTAATLWSAGVRAFAVECRSYTPRKLINIGNNTDSPTRVAVSGLGSNQGGAYTHQTLQESTMIYIDEIITNIANNINSGEFAVLVLSYADGGSGGHRPTIDYPYFINGIKAEIERCSEEVKNKIYSKAINSNTTVGDVMNHLIIKINVDNNLPIGSYDNNMNALISYNPFLNQLSADKYTTPLFSKMYWQNWSDDYKTTTPVNSTDFLWCFSSANRTATTSGADIPTYANRQEALRAMITRSREISENGTHNVWFYFNVGGTEATDSGSDTNAANARTFATTMNPWLLDVINIKSNGGTDTNGYYTGTKDTIVEADPSPLGIVMFNQCTGDNDTYKGADIIKAIVEMNKKFKLERYNPNTEDGDETETDPFA